MTQGPAESKVTAVTTPSSAMVLVMPTFLVIRAFIVTPFNLILHLIPIASN
jgi:hypothetical protein